MLKLKSLKNICCILSFLFISLLIFLQIAQAQTGQPLFLRKPGGLQFTIESTSNEVELSWHQQTEEEDKVDIYYMAEGDFTAENGNSIPKEKMIAHTPYQGGLSLDDWVLFMSEEEEEGVTVLLELDDSVWGSYPAGTYEGKLISNVGGPGQRINITIEMEWDMVLIVFPQELQIDADSGPGFYPARQNVTIQVIANNEDWVLMISAGEFVLAGNPEETPPLRKEDLFLSFAEEGPYKSLEQPVEIFGSEHGSEVELELYFWSQTNWGYRAGTYEGCIYIDLLEDSL